jgi:hypothetical protein
LPLPPGYVNKLHFKTVKHIVLYNTWHQVPPDQTGEKQAHSIWYIIRLSARLSVKPGELITQVSQSEGSPISKFSSKIIMRKEKGGQRPA